MITSIMPLGDVDWLRTRLRQFDEDALPADMLNALVREGWDQLPLPARGRTLLRWRALAVVAARDLSLAKLFEGHTDALAILAELGSEVEPGSVWGMWASEPPGARVWLHDLVDDQVRLTGTKPWCSGAARVSHGLMTVWGRGHGPLLAAVEMAQPGVRVVESSWRAVGMADSESFEVRLDGARARLVGEPGAYLERPGFWHGGCGVAACWYGAAAALGEALASQAARSEDPHCLAHLGRVDVVLSAAHSALKAAAAHIDAYPTEPAGTLALRLRGTMEIAVEEIMQHVGRALGAGPFCMDRWFARTMADLPVFVRQAHAERDLARLGMQVAANKEAPWAL